MIIMTHANPFDNRQVRDWRKRINRPPQRKMNWICNRCGRMYPTTMDFCPKDNVSQARADPWSNIKKKGRIQ